MPLAAKDKKEPKGIKMTVATMPIGSLAIMKETTSMSYGNIIYKCASGITVDLQRSNNWWDNTEEKEVELIKLGTVLQFEVTR